MVICIKHGEMITPFVLVLSTFLGYTTAQNAANFVVQKFYLCEDHPNQQIKLNMTPKNFETGQQVLDIHMFTPVELGNQLRFTFNLEQEITIITKQWQHLFAFEDDLCRLVQVYLGELVYEIETAMGIPPKICPIPKGHYHAVNYTVNFEKMKMQTYPYGKMRTTVQFLQKPKREVLLCAKIIVSNHA